MWLPSSYDFAYGIKFNLVNESMSDVRMIVADDGMAVVRSTEYGYSTSFVPVLPLALCYVCYSMLFYAQGRVR